MVSIYANLLIKDIEKRISDLKAQKNFLEEVKSITKEAHEMAARVYGKLPINDTIEEILNPTGVSLERALFCQSAIDCGLTEEDLKKIIIHNIMSVNKYVHGEIKKVVNGNEYQIVYFTQKYHPIFDGKPDDIIPNEDGFITRYVLYKNNNPIPMTFKPNSTKEELMKTFNEIINILEK